MNRTERFAASAYSLQENAFLLEHLGESPVVACDDVDLPRGVNVAAVRPILQRTYDLEELARSRRAVPWLGYDRLKEVIQLFLDWMAITKEMKRRAVGMNIEMRRAAAIPSMHLWDDNEPFLHGIGADSGRVLTMINEHNERLPLYVNLRETAGSGGIDSLAGVAAWIRVRKDARKAVVAKTGVAPRNPAHVDEAADDDTDPLQADLVFKKFGRRDEKNTVTCPHCGQSETFASGNARSKGAAMARMIKHLRQAKDQVAAHRHLLTRVQRGKGGQVKGAARPGARV